jgi:PhnB protein
LSLFIYVEDVDAVVARAVELGATLQRPPQDQFYGDRDGYVVDPFGHGWTHGGCNRPAAQDLVSR